MRKLRKVVMTNEFPGFHQTTATEEKLHIKFFLIIVFLIMNGCMTPYCCLFELLPKKILKKARLLEKNLKRT